MCTFTFHQYICHHTSTHCAPCLPSSVGPACPVQNEVIQKHNSKCLVCCPEESVILPPIWQKCDTTNPPPPEFEAIDGITRNIASLQATRSQGMVALLQYQADLIKLEDENEHRRRISDDHHASETAVRTGKVPSEQQNGASGSNGEGAQWGRIAHKEEVHKENTRLRNIVSNQ